MLTPQTSTEGLNTAQPSLKDPPSLNLAIDDDGEWKPHLYAPFSLALTTILLAAVWARVAILIPKTIRMFTMTQRCHFIFHSSKYCRLICRNIKSARSGAHGVCISLSTSSLFKGCFIIYKTWCYSSDKSCGSYCVLSWIFPAAPIFSGRADWWSAGHGPLYSGEGDERLCESAFTVSSCSSWTITTVLFTEFPQLIEIPDLTDPHRWYVHRKPTEIAKSWTILLLTPPLFISRRNSLPHRMDGPMHSMTLSLIVNCFQKLRAR